jgi:hypothetical protein
MRARTAHALALCACGALCTCGGLAIDDMDASTDATMSDADVSQPVCPLAAPDAGASCATAPDVDCEYGDSTSFYCNQHYVCDDGQWLLDTRYESQCASQVDCATAVDGGACNNYEVCPLAGSVCVCAVCGGGPPPPPGFEGGAPTWRCFSPGLGCNPNRPDLGTTCDLPDGSACAYAGGTCCMGIAERCMNGVWLSVEGVECL